MARPSLRPAILGDHTTTPIGWYGAEGLGKYSSLLLQDDRTGILAGMNQKRVTAELSHFLEGRLLNQ